MPLMKEMHHSCWSNMVRKSEPWLIMRWGLLILRFLVKMVAWKFCQQKFRLSTRITAYWTWADLRTMVGWSTYGKNPLSMGRKMQIEILSQPFHPKAAAKDWKLCKLQHLDKMKRRLIDFKTRKKLEMTETWWWSQRSMVKCSTWVRR